MIDECVCVFFTVLYCIGGMCGVRGLLFYSGNLVEDLVVLDLFVVRIAILLN